MHRPAILILLLLFMAAEPTGIALLHAQMGESQEQPGIPSGHIVPDPLDLPQDWLSKIESSEFDAATVQSRLDKVIDVVENRIAGLDESNREDAEAALVTLRSNAAALQAAIHDRPKPYQEVIPSQDTFTLDDYLALRTLWRRASSGVASKQGEVDQAEQHYLVLEEGNDRLVEEYNEADRSSPARVVLGIRRMAAGLELLAVGRTNSNLEIELGQRLEVVEELQGRLDFARANLVGKGIILGELDRAIEEASTAQTEFESARSSLQARLLEALSEGEETDEFLVLNLKQQLTRTSAQKMLASLRQALGREKRNWFLLQTNAQESVAEIERISTANTVLVEQTEPLVMVWTNASQATLVTPAPPRAERRHFAQFSQAQEAARQSLELTREIDDSIDGLLQLQALIADLVVEKGLAGIGTRAKLLAGTAWQGMQKVTGIRLFRIGDTPVTTGSVVEFTVIIIVGYLLSWLLRRVLKRIQTRQQQASKSASLYTLGRVLHYLIITIAVLVAFTTIGLDISNLALIAGALSVGIGFGLQSIVNNFLSGLILLFEGSLRVGDFVELDSGVQGVVKEISSRYTRINTNDNVDVIVPNSELVSYKLTNWTLREPVVRFNIPFGVAYGSDKDLVRQAALEAADDVSHTLNREPDRKSDVLLVGFGDNSLDFQLRIWVARGSVSKPKKVRADYYWALESRLREYGIEIPFPQRDLRLRDGFTNSEKVCDEAN